VSYSRGFLLCIADVHRCVHLGDVFDPCSVRIPRLAIFYYFEYQIVLN
jgi:hypothetical protein